MICQCLADLLAIDKSQYFAQPRPIIVNYLNTLHSFLHFSRAINVIRQLYELTPQKRFF